MESREDGGVKENWQPLVGNYRPYGIRRLCLYGNRSLRSKNVKTDYKSQGRTVFLVDGDNGDNSVMQAV